MNFHQINSFLPRTPVIAGDDKFGSSVALSACGTMALVGSLGHNHERGHVHFLTMGPNNQWIDRSCFSAQYPTPENYDIFGLASALSGDGTMALIGASGLTGGVGCGAVYCFTREPNSVYWEQQSLFHASDPVSSDNDQFGISVAMSKNGTKALVASTHQNLYGKNRGAVYYFTRHGKTWTQQSVFGASDPVADNDEFGTSIAMSADGNMALIGAEKSCCQGHKRGVVYCFKRHGNTWMQESHFGPPSSMCSDGDAFGCSIALSANGNIALIGAYEHGFGVGTQRGIAHCFNRQGCEWIYQSSFWAEDPKSADGDEFAVSMAISALGNRALVGAHFQGGGAHGRAYTFDLKSSCPHNLKNHWLWGNWFK